MIHTDLLRRFDADCHLPEFLHRANRSSQVNEDSGTSATRYLFVHILERRRITLRPGSGTRGRSEEHHVALPRFDRYAACTLPYTNASGNSIPKHAFQETYIPSFARFLVIWRTQVVFHCANPLI